MMYKFEHKKLPQVFDKYFQKPAHQYNTRYASTHNNFQAVRISLAKEKSLLKYYGPKVWESISINIKKWVAGSPFQHLIIPEYFCITSNSAEFKINYIC